MLFQTMQRKARSNPGFFLSIKLFEQFIISCIQAISNPSQLSSGNMLDSPFDFYQSFSGNIYIFKLEHSDQLGLTTSLF